MFGVGAAQNAKEAAPQQESVVEEASLSAEVQTAEVAAPSAAHAAPYSLVPATFLAPGTSLEGTLKSKGDVEIAGSFSGEIEADGNVTLRADATISENSEVTGNMSADELLCSGTITGDITVKCGLALEHTARIYGNISAATISMARGAIIKGTVTTEQN